MRVFHCQACASQVYFENSQCGVCQATLGFMPTLGDMAAFPGGVAPGDPWRLCANGGELGLCNWLLPAGDDQPFCASCRLTLTGPPLQDPVGLKRWRAAESAKRRLVFTLLSLGVPFGPKLGADDKLGLQFQWLAPGQAAPAMTGHLDGVVTLNLAEADDGHRETTRVNLGEPQRTVLGHLRHEASHHLHQRWVENSAHEEEFRQRFGDERVDYAAALQNHYLNGPPEGWTHSHISAYASAHPWEDWAETCAHYLLMVDAVETARAWGLTLLDAASGQQVQATATAEVVDAGQLALDHWLPVARFLNAMSRSLGLQDSYPFLLPDPVLDKLRFVQRVLAGAASSAATLTLCRSKNQ